MAEGFPPHVQYWLSPSSSDCFVFVGPESGPSEWIGAVKVILMGHSEPLRKMLQDTTLDEKGHVFLNDVMPETFRTFLKCIYGASSKVIPTLSFEKSTNLLYMVEKYLVTAIKPRVTAHMVYLLGQSVENVFLALSHPICFEDKEIEKAILAIVKHKTEYIFSHDLFVQINTEALLFIVKQDCLNVKDIHIWEAVLKWGKHAVNSSDEKNIRIHIANHLKYIRFCTLSYEELFKKVIPSDILTPEEVYAICKFFGTGNAPNLANISNNIHPRSTCDDDKEAVATIFYYFSSQFQGSENSAEYNDQQGFYWNIKVMRNNNYLGFFLVCNGRRTFGKHWKCFARAELVLVNQDGKPNYVQYIEHSFTNIEEDWGFSQYYLWNSLVNPANGFVKNKKIIVFVNIIEVK